MRTPVRPRGRVSTGGLIAQAHRAQASSPPRTTSARRNPPARARPR